MITMNVQNAKLKKELEAVIAEYLFDNDIEIDVKITPKKGKLTEAQIWSRYCLTSGKLTEYDYISDWSPNNGSEISKIMETNKLLNKLMNWYDNCNRYESVDLLDNLVDNIYYCSKVYKIDDELLQHRDIIEFILDNTDKFPEEFIKDLREVISLFYARNPKFKFDW